VTIDTLLTRVAWATDKSRRRAAARRWTKAEIVRLHDLVGKRNVTAIARELGRSRNAVASKLMQLGYRIKRDVQQPVGLNARELSALIDVPYEQVVRDINAGVIKGAFRESKKDFMVPWRSVRSYENRMQRIRTRREKAIARIKEETITKQEAMQILGLSETHLTRYLQGKIVKAWKIPTIFTTVTKWRWEWLVSKRDAERVRDLRAAGKLHVRMRKKAYRKIADAANQTVLQMRREQRAGQRSAKTLKAFGPRNAVVPGHYTIAQVAQIVGISTQQVYEHSRNGRLQSASVRVGRRAFRTITPEALEAYKAWHARPVKATGPMEAWRTGRNAVHKAGLLTTRESADRYGLVFGSLVCAARDGRVKHRKIKNLLAFKPEDVEAYAAGMRRRKGKSLKEEA
jgi:AraC-like DNA-binding protein